MATERKERIELHEFLALALAYYPPSESSPWTKSYDEMRAIILKSSGCKTLTAAAVKAGIDRATPSVSVERDPAAPKHR
jgi:hypothetical protein